MPVQVRRGRRSVLTVLTVGAVLAAGAGAWLAIGRSGGGGAPARALAAALASQRRAAALSGRLAALAVAAIGTNPSLAQLLAVEATRVDNTPLARAALFKAATVPAGPALVLPAGGAISALAVSADGSAVVAGTFDGTVTEFDLFTGARTQERVGAPILGVAVSAAGTAVAAAYGTGATLWRAGHAPLPLPVRGYPFSIALSPSGQRAAVLSTLSGPLAETNDGLVMPEALTVLGTGRGSQATTTSLGAAGWDGGFTLPREPDLFSSGYFFTELAFPSESMLTVTQTPGAFTDYAPSTLTVIARSTPAPGLGMMQGNSANGAFYGMEDPGQVIEEWPAAATPAHGRAGNGVPSRPMEVTFSNDGKYAAALTGNTIAVSPLTYAQDPGDFGGTLPPGTQLAAPPGTTGVAFAGDGRLVSVSGSTLRVWDMGTAAASVISTVNNDCCGSVSGLEVSSDGRYVSTDDSIFRNAPGLAAVAGVDSQSGAMPAPDGGTIAVLWPGGQPLLAGLDISSGHVIVLNPETALNPGTSVLASIENPDGIVVGSWPVPANSPAAVFAARSASDGRVVIVRGGTGLAVITFNPRTRKSADRAVGLSGYAIPSGIELAPLAISQDGRGAVFAEFGGPAQADPYGQPAQPVLSGSLVYVNLVTGAARDLTSDGVPGGGGVLFTRDLLLITAADGSMQEWDADGDRLLRTLPLAGIGTIGLTASPDGTLLAGVNSPTGVASVADAETGQVIATLPLTSSSIGRSSGTWAGTIMAFSPDDRYLFTAVPGGDLTRWDIGESDLVSIACHRAGYTLTPAIWRQYVHAPPPPSLSCLGPPGRLCWPAHGCSPDMSERAGPHGRENSADIGHIFDGQNIIIRAESV